ncbi:hypothetical protein M9H77_24800 [Catharanthus roseus]|uniref:Uncharacterized protein n=1 Tax=Catharanthus roseus TaxID=4058 RepID=A0ACC0A545_CATRO|nr:hypothetical protein M9H77_24800 [Catharanthus roseus]
MASLLISIFILFIFLTSNTISQQSYSGNSVLNCNSSTDQKSPSPSFLYSCNNRQNSSSSCKAFLIFRALFPYNSVPMIATLISSNQSELARINNATRFTVFPEGTEVIIPVNCSCSASYYQAITKYVPIGNETFFTIANNTYQGLSTCDTLKKNGEKFKLKQGLDFEIPLRCACPTKEQAAKGINYLLTYTVTWGDDVQSISKSFNLSKKSIAEANGFLEEDPTIFPFTTMLVPLPNEPLSRTRFTHRRQPINLPLPFPVSETQRIRSNTKRNLLVGGIIAAGSCLLLFLIVFIFKKRLRRTSITHEKGENDNIWPQDIHVKLKIARIGQPIKIFQYEELKKATRNFSSRNRIKGCVYRGVIHKDVLAIKKIMGNEAYKEAKILSKINHFNLVKLRGYCENQGHLFLVFEYMKNGSLQEWLHRKGKKGWSQRVQIALDIANGLLYLHKFAKPAYVHMDLNSSNILLDSNLRAKISNFSFATELLEETNSSNSKIDIYDFGVVMFELITGKDAVIGENATDGLRNFLETDLRERGDTEYASQVMNLSLRCLMQNPEDRPRMDDVVSTLIKIQRNLQKSDSSIQ